MQIEYLADHPLLVPKLAALHFEQWGYLRPDELCGFAMGVDFPESQRRFFRLSG